MRLAVVYSGAPGARPDAIEQYCRQLVAHLGSRAVLCTSTELIQRPTDTAVLQYNPFSYGRRGFAPDLVRDWRRVGALGTRRLLMVHEPYVPIRNWRSALMGAWQRAQLAALLSMSDRVLVTTEAWKARLPRLMGSALHMPVPSLLPDRRDRREATRRALSLSVDDLVVGTLSSGHSSHVLALVETSLERIAEGGRRIVVFVLGAGAVRPVVSGAVRVVQPGGQPADVLAAHLAACDLFLAPLVDGVSTRRTSIMAALQHEVAVVGTLSESSDAIFRDGGFLRTVGPEDASAFATAARSLALDGTDRAALGRAGREIYEAEFAWDRHTSKVLGATE